MKHTRKLIALAVIIACAVAACGDGSGDGGGGGYGGGGGGGGGGEDLTFDTFSPVNLGLDGSKAQILDKLRTKWEKAIDTNVYGIFYPILSDPFPSSSTSLTVNGVTFKYQGVYGGAPYVRFWIGTGNTIRVFGASGTGGTASLKFDIVIVRSDGQGWVEYGVTKNFPIGSTVVEIDSTAPITISSLTGGGINPSTAAELASGGYEVYAIIRHASRFTDYPDYTGDLNTTSKNDLNQRNVIRIFPDSETP